MKGRYCSYEVVLWPTCDENPPPIDCYKGRNPEKNALKDGEYFPLQRISVMLQGAPDEI